MRKWESGKVNKCNSHFPTFPFSHFLFIQSVSLFRPMPWYPFWSVFCVHPMAGHPYFTIMRFYPMAFYPYIGVHLLVPPPFAVHPYVYRTRCGWPYQNNRWWHRPYPDNKLCMAAKRTYPQTCDKRNNNGWFFHCWIYWCIYSLANKMPKCSEGLISMAIGIKFTFADLVIPG